MDSKGHITSHLVGLAYRTTRLISDYNMKLVLVFDGKSPEMKRRTLEKRREIKEKAEKAYKEALAHGDLHETFSKAVMTSRLDKQVLDDAKYLLDLLGVPWIQAPSEGEAQAAFMCIRGDVWASNSRDYDSLLFGTPRLVRYLTITGEEWLPSKGRARKLFPELIELGKFLKELDITRKQLIDISILIGTDFNNGVNGIGPKNALKLIHKYGEIEKLPEDIYKNTSDNFSEVRNFYLDPPVNSEYEIAEGNFDEEGLIEFLVDERDFSLGRVTTLINRMKKVYAKKSLFKYFGD